MLLIQTAEQILGIFPFGMPVGRAGTFADRQIVFVLKADDIRLIYMGGSQSDPSDPNRLPAQRCENVPQR